MKTHLARRAWFVAFLVAVAPHPTELSVALTGQIDRSQETDVRFVGVTVTTSPTNHVHITQWLFASLKYLAAFIQQVC
jgi:hypothetical protein